MRFCIDYNIHTLCYKDVILLRVQQHFFDKWLQLVHTIRKDAALIAINIHGYPFFRCSKIASNT